MARNTTLSLSAGTWTQFTNADVTSITFQHKGVPGSDILDPTLHVVGTVGAVEPTDFTGAIEYQRGDGEPNTSLSDLWGGISATRVYGYCDQDIDVFVSHA